MVAAPDAGVGMRPPRRRAWAILADMPARRRPGLSLKLSVLLTAGVVGALLFASAFVPDGDRGTWALFTVGVALVTALLYAVVLDWLVTRPLIQLLRQVRRVEEKAYTEPFRPTGTDEPRELGEALERLRRSVVEERRQLQSLNEQLETRVKERTAALGAAQRELSNAEKLASVGRLAGGVAHEINNPAGVILGRASFLLEEGANLPPDIRKDIEVIARQAERIRAITGRLLRFARQSTGRRAPVDLADVARDAAALVRLEARGKRVRIEEDLASRVVEGDSHALEQVAYNLLRNAVHAANGNVLVRTGDAGLVVEDDGPGIAPDNLAKIFEPFFTTKASNEGTGLGLAVSHGIVADHGGRLVAENRAEGGARFTVHL